MSREDIPLVKFDPKTGYIKKVWDGIAADAETGTFYANRLNKYLVTLSDYRANVNKDATTRGLADRIVEILSGRQPLPDDVLQRMDKPDPNVAALGGGLPKRAHSGATEGSDGKSPDAKRVPKGTPAAADRFLTCALPSVCGFFACRDKFRDAFSFVRSKLFSISNAYSRAIACRCCHADIAGHPADVAAVRSANRRAGRKVARSRSVVQSAGSC